MMTSARLKKGGVAALLAITAALLVDRTVLYLWSLSVLRQYQRYRASLSPHPGAPPVDLTEMEEPPLWSGVVHRPAMADAVRLSQIVNFDLSLEPAIARPSIVSIRGYTFSLIYIPPALAWTTRILPLRPHGLPYRMFRSKDHYAYEIAADFSAERGPPVFRLYRLVHFVRQELPPNTSFPRVFP